MGKGENGLKEETSLNFGFLFLLRCPREQLVILGFELLTLYRQNRFTAGQSSESALNMLHSWDLPYCPLMRG